MPWRVMMLTGLAFLQLSLTGCGVKYAYIPSENQVTFPKKGDIVPADGLCLITKGHYVSLHQQADARAFTLPATLEGQ